MRIKAIFISIVLIGAASAQSTAGWQLAWSDEFNGAAGSPPDSTKWNYDLGGGGWGNGEAETYTNSRDNSFQDGNGNLVIRAIRSSTGAYTSARLQTGSPGASTHTTDLSWQYGMVMVRAKLPFGKGVWPAFWMLGEDINTVPWPGCGEVDIMENFGTFNNNININNGTTHGPGYSGGNGISKAYKMLFGEQVNTDYHVYAIQWSQDSVQFYVDGLLYHTVTPASLPSGTQWVFNNNFFILLNLAIGGNSTFLGTPDPNQPFPNQDMLVDYVRVYQPTTVTGVTPVITPGQIVNAASFLGTMAPGGLATVFGSNLADGTPAIDATNGFPKLAGGVTVAVDGVNAPLIYVSPIQINFQIPWETAAGPSVLITVTRGGVTSAPEVVTITPAAPAMFLSETVNGLAWVNGTGCALTECAVQASGNYQLWANGLGPKAAPLQDGMGAVYSGSLPPLEVPGGPDSCQLTIGGQTASVQYCGAAPGEVIDQINFIYPSGVSSTTPYVEATLTVNGVTGNFRVPAPAGGQ